KHIRRQLRCLLFDCSRHSAFTVLLRHLTSTITRLSHCSTHSFILPLNFKLSNLASTSPANTEPSNFDLGVCSLDRFGLGDETIQRIRDEAFGEAGDKRPDHE